MKVISLVGALLLAPIFIATTGVALATPQGGDTAVKQAVTIAEFSQNMVHQRGYFDFYYDASSDKVYLLVDKLAQPFIFQSSLP